MPIRGCFYAIKEYFRDKTTLNSAQGAKEYE